MESDVTDSQVVAAILAGDMSAFARFMTLHKRALFRTARAILRDDAEAEDVVQEAFLRAYRGLDSFRGEAKLSTWLIRIAANLALMRRRRHMRSAREMPVDAGADAAAREGVSEAPGPERGAARTDMRRSLEERIEALPEPYRAVFKLRAVDELTVSETAAALGIPAATVRTRYFRARTLLREAMAPESGQPASLNCPILITERDRKHLRLLKANAALLRELDRAELITPQAAREAGVVTMNTQVFYTDETSGGKHHVNLVYPEEAGGCTCCVSVLDPVGTALVGLSVGQAIDWEFPGGSHRLRVTGVIDHDCPASSSLASSGSDTGLLKR